MRHTDRQHCFMNVGRYAHRTRSTRIMPGFWVRTAHAVGCRPRRERPTRAVAEPLRMVAIERSINVLISLATPAARCARPRTSPATTAKPRPSWPARAASTAALAAVQLYNLLRRIEKMSQSPAQRFCDAFIADRQCAGNTTHPLERYSRVGSVLRRYQLSVCGQATFTCCFPLSQTTPAGPTTAVWLNGIDQVRHVS